MIWLELALAIFVVLGAVFVAFAKDILGAIVMFAGLTLGIAVIWVLLAAPDVALIEAAVGAGVISVLFLITAAKTTGVTRDEREQQSSLLSEFRSLNYPALAIVAALAAPMLYTFLSLPEIGSETAPAVSTHYFGGDDLTPYGFYIQETLPITDFPNAVVAVLVAFRGLDTLGELIVAFSAAVSILIVLDREDLL